MPAIERQRVAGVVLAAGTASRMGRNKLLFELDGRALVAGAVERAVAAGLDPIVVVVGHEPQRVEEAVRGLPCRTIHNPDYAEGIHVSARVGVGAVAEEASALVMVLADMPHVSADMIATLVRRYRDGGAPIVASRYGDVNAPPVLYDRALFGELRDMTKGCGKQVVQRHVDRAEMVDWPGGRLRDVDTPGDWEALTGDSDTPGDAADAAPNGSVAGNAAPQGRAPGGAAPDADPGPAADPSDR